jgi:hypothetical protein
MWGEVWNTMLWGGDALLVPSMSPKGLFRAGVRKLPQRISFLLLVGLVWTSAGVANQDFYPGSYAGATVIGNSLPGTWRPFSDDSPWNTPIPPDATPHALSDIIIATLVAEASNIRLANRYVSPIWVVNADNIDPLMADSPYPFDTWDQNYDGVTEAGVPILPSMYPENTSDGHIIVVDPFHKFAWEMSRYTGIFNGVIDCSTFNIWDLTGDGVGDSREGIRWDSRGGRGSGFPIIAGIIRPEEILAGEIRHAMVFTFGKNRSDGFYKPAVRNDGKWTGSQYPREGMHFQLDPTLTDLDFDNWGLDDAGKVLARALQVYGMFDGDNGGDMALEVQLLDPDPDLHRAKWESLVPGFYDNVKKIPTNRFRLMHSGSPITGGAETTAVAPLILPIAGAFVNGQEVTISTPTPGAQIYYTTDGLEPTESSAAYSAPFEINHTATVRARAFVNGMTPSPVARASLKEKLPVPVLSPLGLLVLAALLTANGLLPKISQPR